MYVYVDESGNTGYRVFDPEQPLFVTAAMMTKTNFDAVRKGALAAIARKVGASALHANELGVGRIEEIADDLLKIVKQADARFFVSRLEKRYLVAAKVYDTYFDAGENLAVPWHAYWIRPLRLTLMFKIVQYVLTEEIAGAVWDCVTAPTAQKSKAFFIQAAESMLARAPNLPDARSREIVTTALQWAINNPENFSTHIRDKINRHAHTPNFVAFTDLIDGVSRASKAWNRPVREIVHDRQSQFERKLIQWHEVFSRPELAKDDPIHWPGDDEPISLSRVPGSRFRMATEETSPGLQVIDVVLWLFQRAVTGKEIGPGGERLLTRVFRYGYQNDLTFDAIANSVEHQLDKIWDTPLTEEQKRAGAELMSRGEANRIAAMTKYATQKAFGTDT